MDRIPDKPAPTLRHESSIVSDYSVDSSSTVIGSPPSPIQHRAGYRRVSSMGGFESSHKGAEASYREGSDESRSYTRGLGIDNLNGAQQASVQRAPSGSKREARTPNSTDTLLSPPSAQFGLSYTRNIDERAHDDSQDFSFSQFSTPSLSQPFSADSEFESLNKKNASPSLRPHDASGSDSGFYCNADSKLMAGRKSWFSGSILFLSLYSTVFSGLWLGVAWTKPHYGQRITTNGSLPYSTASLLCAAFAKTIELSYVAVFVTFLGQVLSRRALVHKSKGITIAEMSMRSWIIQPGTMFIHWETLRYAAFTFLGALSLLAALMAMFYTTASDTLVSPKLSFGVPREQTLHGKVSTQYANMYYIQDHCQTPISKVDDPDASATTCMAIEHAGQAFHNYMQYLKGWTNYTSLGNSSSDLQERPKPVALMYDNTTIEGSWINMQDMPKLSTTHGRIINNVSMAMPHTGVFAATRDPINNIMQPQDLTGLGDYQVKASVPSPSINVLCANMSEEELLPMISSLWPGHVRDESYNVSNIPLWPSWLNKTSVDDVFGFGEEYGRRHPVFPKLPIPFNTVFNHSGPYTDSVYVLACSAPSNYMLCSLRSSQTPGCSTEYNNSLAGGSMRSRCEGTANRLAYQNIIPNATYGVIDANWAAVGANWGEAMSLGAGISDGNASNARLLTQLVPTTYSLNTSLPSIAEALAVLSGCTLILSALDAPLKHFWDYPPLPSTLDTPQYQQFFGTLSFQDYASGGAKPWQNIFYLVLVIVFGTNVFCLVYFLKRGGLVTDFIEPQNLFTLSLNSPSSDVLEGSCGSGPEGEQFRAKWHIKKNLQRDHFYIENQGGLPTPRLKRSPPPDYEMENSPAASQYERLAGKHTSLLGD